MDQERDELKYSNVKGRNPFKDLRVRQALYMAIDIEAIKRQVMRGNSVPTGAMIPSPTAVFPELEPRAIAVRPVERSRKLLAEAGYPNGFEMGLLCPNNRYVNDERICTAIAGMFAKVGVTVKLERDPARAILPEGRQLRRVHAPLRLGRRRDRSRLHADAR